jgi:hypothetical protein
LAAKFLAGGEVITPEAERNALYQEDGDVERAALLAYGLELSPENIKALHSIVKLGDLNKSEKVACTAETVVAARPEGEDVAEMLRRAFKDSFVFEAELGGKHSKGSMLAMDNETHTTWLLKSGSGGAGAAAGATQDLSSPDAREAAWYHIAEAFGVRGYPRAELIVIDGKPFAAMEFLGGTYESLDKKNREEPGTSRKVLAPYLQDGVIHQWATLDYVMGNGDSHGSNVLIDKAGDVKLIDHGSAFAGTEFDPAHDGNSFTPFTLRAWAPSGVSFNQMTPEDKLRYLPTLPEAVGHRLNLWVSGLSTERLGQICTEYGIDPQPTVARLERVKRDVSEVFRLDVTINGIWVAA